MNRYFRTRNLIMLAIALLLATAFANTVPRAQDAAWASGDEFGLQEVTIEHAEPFDKVSGYTYAEAMMTGTIERDDGSTGEYEVPLVLIYPDDGGNGVGIVDIPNSVAYGGTGFEVVDPSSTLQVTRMTTDGYLFEQGYTYASVQWNKEVTDLFASVDGAADENHLVAGSIERTEDAWHIMRDAAAFLRDPTALENPNGPQAVDTMLSSGYSATGVILNTFVLEGENQGAYDGHLIGTGGYSCYTPLEANDNSDEPEPLWMPVPCEGEHEGDARVISIITEATAAFNAVPRFEDFEDGEPENWRQYELAGVAHTNPVISPDGPEDRNPIIHIPVFRAAFHNLAMWAADGVEPPPSRLLEGEVQAPENFPVLFVPERDEHGNALGGLRLPHMEQMVDNRPAGAPLGTYTGLRPEEKYADAWFEPPSSEAFAGILTHITGTFEPFDDEVLNELYPNPGSYVSRVARAAEHLYEQGYILEADKDEYVREAAQSGVGRPDRGNNREHRSESDQRQDWMLPFASRKGENY
jgi:hypothetical protein